MRIERIIWFAMFMSTVIYALIVFLVAQRGSTRPFEEAVRVDVVLILYAVALLMFIIGTFPGAALRNKPYRFRMIGGLATYEACAILGLVAAFIYSDWRLFLAPWALTIIGFLRVFPTSEPG